MAIMVFQYDNLQSYIFNTKKADINVELKKSIARVLNPKSCNDWR